MIVGGTGITPMLQIIRAVIRGRLTSNTIEIDLIFANINPEDILSIKGELGSVGQGR
jgi:cytochrome-b5 reductase